MFNDDPYGGTRGPIHISFWGPFKYAPDACSSEGEPYTSSKAQAWWHLLVASPPASNA